jgi:hypothetical protein
VSFSLEADLVLLGVRRWFCRSEEPVALQDLLQRRPDWTRVIELAIPNGVVPLLHQCLRDRPDVPEAVRRELETRAEEARRGNLALARELHRIIGVFREQEVPVLSFKGPELASEAYGDLGLRPFGDIDLMIRPEDIARVNALLVREGYSLRATRTWQHFFAKEAGAGLDVHWALGARWMRSPASFDQWWAGARRIPVEGVPVPTMAVDDLLLVISLLLTKDCMFRRQHLIQLCDIAAVLARHATLDWDSLLERARALDMHRVVLFQCVLAADLLGVPLPGALSVAAERDPVSRELAAEARSGFLREVWEPTTEGGTRPGPGVAGHRFFLRSQARLGHRLQYLRVMVPEIVRMAVTPTDRDRAFLPMARPLSPLYYLVRPVRVFRQWVRTGYLILD